MRTDAQPFLLVEERVTDRQVPDSLAVPKVLGEEPRGPAFDGRLDHEGIPKGVFVLFVKVDRPQDRPALHWDDLPLQKILDDLLADRDR